MTRKKMGAKLNQSGQERANFSGLYPQYGYQNQKNKFMPLRVAGLPCRIYTNI